MSKTIGIFAPGQNGDCLTISSVLRYKDELWGPDVKIVWFIADENRDLLKYNPDVELRHFAHGWQISEQDKATIYTDRIAKDKADDKPEWGDWSVLRMPDNKMNTNLKHLFPILSDIDIGYFPAPHQLHPDQRSGTTYPNCSKRIFGVEENAAWHPVLYHSPEESLAAAEFIDALPKGRKLVLVETFGGSAQSKINHNMILDALDRCDEAWGQCNFVFLSHKYLNSNYGMETFPESILSRSVSAAHFTVRQCALLGQYADLILSVSSGVTCALSCWHNKPVPLIQFCGSAVCGTKELALGECIQVFTDDNPNAEKEYFEQLNFLLHKYK